MTKSLEVIKDPHSEGTIDDIMLQNQLVTKIYDDINLAVHYINSIEVVRRQLLDLKAMLKNTNHKEELISLVDDLESEFLELEKQLTQLKTTGTGQDEVRYEKMIGEKLSYLADNVQISDFRPADSYYEVHKLLKSRLDKVGEQFEKLKNENLKNTLSSLRDKGVDIIVME